MTCEEQSNIEEEAMAAEMSQLDRDGLFGFQQQGGAERAEGAQKGGPFNKAAVRLNVLLLLGLRVIQYQYKSKVLELQLRKDCAFQQSHSTKDQEDIPAPSESTKQRPPQVTVAAALQALKELLEDEIYYQQLQPLTMDQAQVTIKT